MGSQVDIGSEWPLYYIKLSVKLYFISLATMNTTLVIYSIYLKSIPLHVLTCTGHLQVVKMSETTNELLLHFMMSY
jgi:hypothetical protein